ncbi:hypothetical protein JYU34_006182 [Plutella xylostella]|uniref:Uncharacterized protein n=1 Tax=Plutella xylostella TaxID=51655 RepID=A0ABQ7QV24_PLUXY|nr:hypothetical protein JYU34_006182 [Plutella xylostella]
MEEESVTVIRESTRNLVRLSRRNHRGEDTDLRRSIPDSCKSSGTVVDIASKLKTKSPVSVDELRTLKNALLEDSKNIEIVLSTHGALRGLVREISGDEYLVSGQPGGLIRAGGRGAGGAGRLGQADRGPGFDS